MDIEERVSELEQSMNKISEIIDKITSTFDKERNETEKSILLLTDIIADVNSRVEVLTKNNGRADTGDVMIGGEENAIIGSKG